MSNTNLRVRTCSGCGRTVQTYNDVLVIHSLPGTAKNCPRGGGHWAATADAPSDAGRKRGLAVLLAATDLAVKIEATGAGRVKITLERTEIEISPIQARAILHQLTETVERAEQWRPE